MMDSSSETLREWTLPSGSLVEIDGVPYELTASTVIRGAMKPRQVVADRQPHSITRSGESDKQNGARHQAMPIKSSDIPLKIPSEIKTRMVVSAVDAAVNASAARPLSPEDAARQVVEAGVLAWRVVSGITS